MTRNLKEEVLAANIGLADSGLVCLTWGNVSGVDREQDLVAIKPSGKPYRALEMEDIVLLTLEGKVVDGDLNPSSDLATHMEMYRRFTQIGAIAHVHSAYACMFAQACREIPCLGTTHADHFSGPVPVTRPLTPSEVEEDYTGNTGKVIAETLGKSDVLEIPAILVAHHGPFTWGGTPGEAVSNAVALETVAKMAMGAYLLDPGVEPLPEHIKLKHYRRKHGADATYGQ